MLLKTTRGLPVTDRVRPGFPSPDQRQVSVRSVSATPLSGMSAHVRDGLVSTGRAARRRIATLIYPDLLLQTSSSGIWDAIGDEDDD